MQLSRRLFVRGSIALAALWAMPRALLAGAWPDKAFASSAASEAMTELFGGFDDRFYQSYRHAWTLDPGYSTRKVLYNLYHILNHYNLFGGGYAERALGMIDHLISEIS